MTRSPSSRTLITPEPSNKGNEEVSEAVGLINEEVSDEEVSDEEPHNQLGVPENYFEYYGHYPGEEPIREVLTIRSPTAQGMGKEMVEQGSCSPPHREEAKVLGGSNTVHIRFTGAHVSHTDIDICLRPSKRRAENAELIGTPKAKRPRIEDDGENANPNVEEKDVKKQIAEVLVRVY